MRAFPVRIGRIVDFTLPSGQRRACKVTTVVSGQTVHLKELSSGTVRNSIVENNTHGSTGGWKRP